MSMLSLHGSRQIPASLSVSCDESKGLELGLTNFAKTMFRVAGETVDRNAPEIAPFEPRMFEYLASVTDSESDEAGFRHGKLKLLTDWGVIEVAASFGSVNDSKRIHMILTYSQNIQDNIRQLLTEWFSLASSGVGYPTDGKYKPGRLRRFVDDFFGLIGKITHPPKPMSQLEIIARVYGLLEPKKS